MDADKVKDLYLSKEAVKRLIELLVNDVASRVPGTTNTIPMTLEDATDPANKDLIPTVLAVYNALEAIDHIKFRLMKGAAGQSFEDYIGDSTPEELALYFYRTVDKPNFDLWIYDSTQGYRRVGYDSVSAEDLDLSEYWSKEELDMNAYWSKSELTITDLVGEIDLTQYVKTETLNEYLRKDEIGTMSREELEEIWNEVVSGSSDGSSSGNSGFVDDAEGEVEL